MSGGEGGIRTPDTLLGCNCLAGSPVRPLQHLSATPLRLSLRQSVRFFHRPRKRWHSAVHAETTLGMTLLPHLRRRNGRFKTDEACFHKSTRPMLHLPSLFDSLPDQQKHGLLNFLRSL
jgi:hypothetical protein